MHVLAQLDRARAQIDVLEHPFYRRWSAGQLAAQELACYAALRNVRFAVRGDVPRTGPGRLSCPALAAPGSQRP